MLYSSFYLSESSCYYQTHCCFFFFLDKIQTRTLLCKSEFLSLWNWCRFPPCFCPTTHETEQQPPAVTQVWLWLSICVSPDWRQIQADPMARTSSTCKPSMTLNRNKQDDKMNESNVARLHGTALCFSQFDHYIFQKSSAVTELPTWQHLSHMCWMSRGAVGRGDSRLHNHQENDMMGWHDVIWGLSP